MKRLWAALLVLAPACSKAGPTLYVFNWGDYFAKDTIANFEKEFGCQVKVDEITSTEELRAKLLVPPSGYDVVFASDEIVPTLIAQGLLEKLDGAKLPNLRNLMARWRNLPFDPANAYSVPYMWGTTGIAYNREKVSPPPDSWTALWDPKVANRDTLLKDPREVFAAAMWAEGESPFNPSTGAIEKAKKRLLTRKPRAYTSTPKDMLIQGDAWISQCFSGDALQAAEAAPVDYVIPKEGGTLWLDTMCVPKGARTPDLAHQFIDYLLRPEVSAAISNETFFANPNEPAQKLIKKEVLENPIAYPREEDLKRCSLLRDLPPDLKKKLHDAWAEVKGQ